MIWVLIKKDFLFNWKSCIACVLAVPIAFLAELLDDGISPDEQLSFTVILALCCMIPTIHSLNKENTPSTKQFLSSLPMNTKELILSKFFFTLSYSALNFAVLILSNRIFDFGLSAEHFLAGAILTISGGAAYIYCSYIRNRELAQLLMWCTFFPLVFFVVWIRDTAMELWIKANLTMFLVILLVSAAVSAAAVFVLQKKKRRL